MASYDAGQVWLVWLSNPDGKGLLAILPSVDPLSISEADRCNKDGDEIIVVHFITSLFEVAPATQTIAC